MLVFSLQAHYKTRTNILVDAATMTCTWSASFQPLYFNPLGDHNYTTRQSPTEMKLKKRVKRLEHRVLEEKKKVKDLEDALHELNVENMVSKEFYALLKDQFSGMQLELLNNERSHRAASSKAGYRYSNLIKRFSMTLMFYSPRAYDFIRQYFSLPHPRTLQMWSGSIDCQPGFLKNVLDALTANVKDCPDAADATLIMDAMSIKKDIIFNKHLDMNEGFVDYGARVNLEGGEDVIASEAFVMMLVGQRKRWKVPIGYFLTANMTAEILSKLVQRALFLAKEANIFVHILTFDGASTNISAVKKLGMKYDKNNIDGQLDINLTGGQVVFAVLDACHLIKLSRNCLADIKVIIAYVMTPWFWH